MTQKDLKDNAYLYIKYNLKKEARKELVAEILQDFYNLKEQLELTAEILDNVINCFYIDGYKKESNTLLTCLLSINEILKQKDFEKKRRF